MDRLEKRKSEIEQLLNQDVPDFYLLRRKAVRNAIIDGKNIEERLKLVEDFLSVECSHFAEMIRAVMPDDPPQYIYQAIQETGKCVLEIIMVQATGQRVAVESKMIIRKDSEKEHH